MKIEVAGYAINRDTIVGVGPIYIPERFIQKHSGHLYDGWCYAFDLIMAARDVPIMIPETQSYDVTRNEIRKKLADEARQKVIDAVFP